MSEIDDQKIAVSVGIFSIERPDVGFRRGGSISIYMCMYVHMYMTTCVCVYTYTGMCIDVYICIRYRKWTHTQHKIWLLNWTEVVSRQPWTLPRAMPEVPTALKYSDKGAPTYTCIYMGILYIYVYVHVCR